MIFSFIFIVFVAVFGYFYLLYTSIIKKRNKMFEAFSSIDVYLKKRYDLIPNILTILKTFMDHEKTIMEEVVKLRARALCISDNFESIPHKLDVNSKLTAKMNNLLVSAENYPELKSDKVLLTAMKTYNDIEEHIAAARRFYNSAVNELNNAVEIFPSSLIAAMLGIKKTEYFYNK